jgi:hypothetical protein
MTARAVVQEEPHFPRAWTMIARVQSLRRPMCQRWQRGPSRFLV